MFPSQRNFYRLTIFVALFVGILGRVRGLTIAYCSTVNTGSTPGNYSEFQSNGLCRTFCADQSYALAVLQSNECWCSNYVPDPTESTSNCANSCPGFLTDTCGGDGTYGYILLGNPSGTEGSDSSTAAKTSSTTASTAPSSTEQATTAPASITTSPSTSSTWTPTPTISLETVTGQVHTVTVTPTVPPDSQNQSGTTTKKSLGGLGTGGAVGLTIGLVALVALVAGIIYFCWRKRKQGEEVDDGSRRDSATTALGGPIPSRTMSENSRFVLGTDGRRVVETWEPVGPTQTRNSSGFMPVDPRLDPFAPVYQRGEGSKSRESVATIQDDRDYSRRVHQPGKPILRATNPD